MKTHNSHSYHLVSYWKKLQRKYSNKRSLFLCLSVSEYGSSEQSKVSAHFLEYQGLTNSFYLRNWQLKFLTLKFRSTRKFGCLSKSLIYYLLIFYSFRANLGTTMVEVWIWNKISNSHTAQKMKFSIKDFFWKYDQICRCCGFGDIY